MNKNSGDISDRVFIIPITSSNSISLFSWNALTLLPAQLCFTVVRLKGTP